MNIKNQEFLWWLTFWFHPDQCHGHVARPKQIHKTMFLVVTSKNSYGKLIASNYGTHLEWKRKCCVV